MTHQQTIEHILQNSIIRYNKYYYSDSYIRECKLNEIDNKQKPRFNKENFKILFKQDFKNHVFYYNNEQIYKLFNIKLNQIQISNVLKNYEKLNQLIPIEL